MHAQILFCVRFFVSGGKRFWNSRSIGNGEQGKADLLEGTGLGRWGGAIRRTEINACDSTQVPFNHQSFLIRIIYDIVCTTTLMS